jgi:hypothetical protein
MRDDEMNTMFIPLILKRICILHGLYYTRHSTGMQGLKPTGNPPYRAR